jgi:hypothetical protein
MTERDSDRAKMQPTGQANPPQDGCPICKVEATQTVLAQGGIAVCQLGVTARFKTPGNVSSFMSRGDLGLRPI